MYSKTEKLVADFLVSKQPYLTPLAVGAFCPYDEILNLVDIYITADTVEQVCKYMKDYAVPDRIYDVVWKNFTLRHGPWIRDY